MKVKKIGGVTMGARAKYIHSTSRLSSDALFVPSAPAQTWLPHVIVTLVYKTHNYIHKT